MSVLARSGVLIYAKHLATVSAFYERVLGASVVHADADHTVLESPDGRLIIHAIPQHIAASIALTQPPAPREEQAIKPFFTVHSLAATERGVEASGGRLHGAVWSGTGMTARSVCDPEGNVILLQEMTP